LHVPDAMSATDPVLVCVIVVLVVYVTVVSPLLLLRISLLPLICTSWPAAALRAKAPRPALPDDGEGVVVDAAAPPHAATISAAPPPRVASVSRFMLFLLLMCDSFGTQRLDGCEPGRARGGID